MESDFKDCPKCKARNTIERTTTHNTLSYIISIKKCTECKHQIGMKTYQNLE